MSGAEQIELYFHAGEILAFVLGAAVPVWLGYIQLRRILRDYPPHRHNNDGSVTYPKGYEPPRSEQLFRTQTAGK